MLRGEKCCEEKAGTYFGELTKGTIVAYVLNVIGRTGRKAQYSNCGISELRSSTAKSNYRAKIGLVA